MRKFTKMVLTLALLFGAWGGQNSVKARDVHANIANGVKKGEATWVQVGETSTYTYTWTDTGDDRNDYISLFTAFGGVAKGELDWSDGTNFIFTCSGPSASETNALNVIIVANGNEFSRAMYSDGTKTLTLTATGGDGFKNNGTYITAEDLEHVTDIRIQATNKSGSVLTAGSVNVENFYVQLCPKTTLSFNASGVATVNLDDIDVAGDASYNKTTHIVTSSGSGAFLVNFDKADFRNVTGITLNATTSGTESEIALSDILGSTEVYDNINKSLVTWSYSKWDYNFTSYKSNASQVIYIKVNLKSGSMKINSITITADAMQLSNPNSLNVAGPYAKWTGVTSEATVAQAATPAWYVGGATGTVYGDVNVNSLYYADLKDFKTMKIYVNASSATIRAMFNRAADQGDFFNVQVDPSTGNLSQPGYSSYADGVFTVDLAKILADKGTVHLNAIKAAAGQSNAYVDRVILEPITPSAYDYVLSGQYSSATDFSEFTSDASATAIDCSSLSGNDVTLISANPNCLFVAKAGVLANASNVIVSDACAQLAITDGNPFKAPAAFTATAAPTYSRVFTTSSTTTVCLPFALTSDEAATLGTFYELTGFDGATLRFTSVAAPEANKAYLVIPTATGLTMSETNKYIDATPAGLGSAITNVDFIGTLSSTAIPASDASYTYFAYNNGSLVKVTTAAATLPAFRGYFKVTTSAISGDARSLNICFDDETTGISRFENAESGQEYSVYDLQGRRISQPTKGLYIVNGKKVMVK